MIEECWSVLQQGVSIPVTIQVVFQNTIKKFLPRGQSKDIYLSVGRKDL
jgi:5-methylcytosine-specific restriction protein A